MSARALIRMQEISKRFGATEALKEVTFEVGAGEVHALIGENGAGKSTLVKVLSGALRADSGSMQLRERPYTPRGPHDARLAGVAMIYQELNLAPDLSVLDNVMLGRELGRWGRAQQRQRVREALDLLGHADLDLDVPVRALSVGVQQLVEIARALVIRARVIVFDEPTSSLTAADAARLFAVIGKLRSRGLGIIYISHYLEEVRRVCDRYTVLRDGQVVGSGTLAHVSDSDLVAMMVGRSIEELFPRVPHEIGGEVLSLEGVSGRVKPHGVSLALKRGEILGIAGPVGAGRTELLRAIFGLDAVREGRVKVAGVDLRARPRAAIRAGLGFVSENRKTEGLAQTRSIADNLTYSRLAPYGRFGWLNLRRRAAAVAGWMERLQVKALSGEQEVGALSGGNQQKVAIARLLHQDADVLLLDEPTRGIDVATKAAVYGWIGQLAARGKAVLFVSSYLPELLAVCDRIAVMSRGRLRDVRPAERWTEHELMAAAIATR